MMPPARGERKIPHDGTKKKPGSKAGLSSGGDARFNS
jgi:hypothetical protein